MEQLVRQDKITYVGSSNSAAWNIAQACETARARFFLGLVSEQSVYSLAKRTVELEVLPACRAYGVGFICWSPLAGGMLAGAVQKADSGRRAKLDISEEPATVALAWVLHSPLVTAPVMDPRAMAQLRVRCALWK
jgi:aryl-alcohol dehydrogenase-like predicted oxidoreductase